MTMPQQQYSWLPFLDLLVSNYLPFFSFFALQGPPSSSLSPFKLITEALWIWSTSMMLSLSGLKLQMHSGDPSLTWIVPLSDTVCVSRWPVSRSLITMLTRRGLPWARGFDPSSSSERLARATEWARWINALDSSVKCCQNSVPSISSFLVKPKKRSTDWETK